MSKGSLEARNRMVDSGFSRFEPGADTRSAQVRHRRRHRHSR